MSFRLRKLAGTAALAVVASGLSVTSPLITPASAAVPTEKAFVVADRNGDGFAGLFTEPTPTGPLTVVVDDVFPHHIKDVSASADGSRVIYVQLNYSTITGAPTTQQVIVRDVSRTVVRVLETRTVDFHNWLGTPVLSPDGNEAVWDVHDRNSTARYLRKADVASGGPVTLKLGITPYGFLDNTTVLAQDINGNPFTIPYAGGNKVATAGLPVDAIHVTVSRDGTKLAYGLFDSSVPSGAPERSTMNVAPVTVTNGVATVGSPTELASGAFDEEPAFSHDDARVYWVRNNGTATGKGDIWSAPTDASAPAAVTAATTADEWAIGITETDDGTPPSGSLVAKPAVLNGTAVRLNWTLPPLDADVSGVQVSCTYAGSQSSPSGLRAFVPAPLETYVGTGLFRNLGYVCTYLLRDRSGNTGSATSHPLTALQATPSFADPTSTTSNHASFPVSFSSSNTPANAVFKADYLLAGTATWTPWVTGATGRVRTFGTSASANVNATTSTPGTSYVFRVRAMDPYGNATAWVSSTRAVVPFDQSKATLVGGTNISATAAYLGSYRRLSKTSDYARVTLVGNRLQVVGWKCSTCGAFAIYDGSTLIATVDTHASSTIGRAVLYTRSYSSQGTHTFTIRPKATAGRPYVLLDGFAIRR